MRSYIAAVIRPPNDIVLYALALKDPRERVVTLMGIEAAFRILENDQKWKDYIKAGIDELKPTAREMEGILVDAGLATRALREEMAKKRAA